MQSVYDFREFDELSTNDNIFFIHVGSKGFYRGPLENREAIDLMITEASKSDIDSATAFEVNVAKELDLLIWIGITSQKRSWKEQINGYAHIINKLHVSYPKLGVVIDGWTSPLTPSAADLKETASDQKVAAAIADRFTNGIKTFSVTGSNSVRKLAFAQEIDLFIANGGTGSLFVDRFARKKGVLHIANVARQVMRKTQMRFNSIEVPEIYVVDVNADSAPNPENVSYSIESEHIYDLVLPLIHRKKH
jgi:hypothetical protein